MLPQSRRDAPPAERDPTAGSGLRVPAAARSRPRAGVSLPAQCLSPLKPSQEMLLCQFTNVPVGLSFQAHTWSV